MSPKNPSPGINRASSGEPYPSRRASGQPKSTRQQYSACGACRMRRVRCDLKDLPILGSGQHPPCSNCSERGLNCVDEFAEVKAVKLLRRGRRLQKVEAVYGKTPKDEVDLHSVTPPRSVIPQLKPEFFRSPFFRRFHVQRPIIEPAEFCARFNEFAEGNTEYLDVPGQLVALALVVWAASYGVNEYGVEDTHEGPADIRKRKELVNQMLDEFLYLIDIHGILRKPSWDGVRVLLLIMPLTQDAQSPMDRLAMYDATLSQVYSLCSLASSSSVDSGQGEYVDALVRARIFWYAHVLDGVTSGLRGGRLSLTEDDLKSFETTLPSPHSLHDNPAAASYSFTYRFATIPIHIASVCRAIHSALTGPKARREDDVDESKLQYAWDTLERCWNDFDGLRRYGTAGIVQAEDVERFIDAWQIFVFECHNVIREGLKQRLVSQTVPDNSYPPEAARSRKYEAISRLHMKANVKCNTVVRYVVTIIRRNLGTAFFQYDAAIVRDGVFFAGFLLAGESGTREDVETCLRALSEMRWAFCKSEDREQTVRMVWESRLTQSRGATRSFPSSPIDDVLRSPPILDSQYPRRPSARPLSVPPLSLSVNGMSSQFASSSAPNTACSSDGNWPSTASVSSSEAEAYQASIASDRSTPPSLPSRSSSYVHSPTGGLSINVLRPDDSTVGPPPLVLEASVRTPSGPSHPYYLANYNYLAMGETTDAPSTASEHQPRYPPTQYFDPTGVAFSSTPVDAGSGYLTTPSAGQGGGPQFGDGAFYG